MTKDQESAIDNLRSGNYSLSEVVKTAVYNAVQKSSDMIQDCETPESLLTAIKVIETSSKIVGLSPKETQTNIQINAINGFDFIEIDEDDIKQITTTEDFEDADIS